MKSNHQSSIRIAASALAAGFLMSAASFAYAADMAVTLSGEQEVPAVKASGTGNGKFTVGADKSLSGAITTTGVAGTMAHIHTGEMGKNGPVTIPLTKSGDTYTVPAGVKLTDAQEADMKAGKMYVNVHTAANPGGEIRAQLK